MYDNVGECNRAMQATCMPPRDRRRARLRNLPGRVGHAGRPRARRVPLPRPTGQLRVDSGNDMMLETREYPGVSRTGRSQDAAAMFPETGQLSCDGHLVVSHVIVTGIMPSGGY